MGWFKDKKEEFISEFNKALSSQSSKLEKEGKILPIKYLSNKDKSKIKNKSELSSKSVPNKSEGLVNSYLKENLFYIIGERDKRSLKEVANDKNLNSIELVLFIFNRFYNKTEKFFKSFLGNVYIYIAYLEVFMILLTMMNMNKTILLFYVPVSTFWIGYCFYNYRKELREIQLTFNNVEDVSKDDLIS